MQDCDSKKKAAAGKKKLRPDWLIAGLMLLIPAVMLLVWAGPVDHMFMGEPYEVRGELQDCYIEETGGKHSSLVLRILVDGEEYTVWDEYMGMSQQAFQGVMLQCTGREIRLTCVDSPGYDRHVIGLVFDFHTFIHPNRSLEQRKSYSREMGWLSAGFALASAVCLLGAFSVIPVPGKKKKD